MQKSSWSGRFVTDEERLVHCIGAAPGGPVRSSASSRRYPSEHINKAIYKRSSFVRWFVLLGGITGIVTAFVMTIGTSLEWNLVTGGKPIASIPPYHDHRVRADGAVRRHFGAD